MLTVLRRVDDSHETIGSFPFAVEGLHFDLKLCGGEDGRVFVDVVFSPGVCHSHLPPLVAIPGLKGDDVAKVTSIVVLWLHWLEVDGIETRIE